MVIGATRNKIGKGVTVTQEDKCSAVQVASLLVFWQTRRFVAALAFLL
jgi:hypothetical protein